jgi:hypothetical protein
LEAAAQVWHIRSTSLHANQRPFRCRLFKVYTQALPIFVDQTNPSKANMYMQTWVPGNRRGSASTSQTSKQFVTTEANPTPVNQTLASPTAGSPPTSTPQKHAAKASTLEAVAAEPDEEEEPFFSLPQLKSIAGSGRYPDILDTQTADKLVESSDNAHTDDDAAPAWLDSQLDPAESIPLVERLKVLQPQRGTSAPASGTLQMSCQGAQGNSFSAHRSSSGPGSISHTGQIQSKCPNVATQVVSVPARGSVTDCGCVVKPATSDFASLGSVRGKECLPEPAHDALPSQLVPWGAKASRQCGTSLMHSGPFAHAAANRLASATAQPPGGRTQGMRLMQITGRPSDSLAFLLKPIPSVHLASHQGSQDITISASTLRAHGDIHSTMAAPGPSPNLRRSPRSPKLTSRSPPATESDCRALRQRSTRSTPPPKAQSCKRLSAHRSKSPAPLSKSRRLSRTPPQTASCSRLSSAARTPVLSTPSRRPSSLLPTPVASPPASRTRNAKARAAATPPLSSTPTPASPPQARLRAEACAQESVSHVQCATNTTPRGPNPTRGSPQGATHSSTHLRKRTAPLSTTNAGGGMVTTPKHARCPRMAATALTQRRASPSNLSPATGNHTRAHQSALSPPLKSVSSEPSNSDILAPAGGVHTAEDSTIGAGAISPAAKRSFRASGGSGADGKAGTAEITNILAARKGSLALVSDRPLADAVAVKWGEVQRQSSWKTLYQSFTCTGLGTVSVGDCVTLAASHHGLSKLVRVCSDDITKFDATVL